MVTILKWVGAVTQDFDRLKWPSSYSVPSSSGTKYIVCWTGKYKRSIYKLQRKHKTKSKQKREKKEIKTKQKGTKQDRWEVETHRIGVT